MLRCEKFTESTWKVEKTKKEPFLAWRDLKAMERCTAKVANDYSSEKYPTAAKLLDIVRCSLVFDSCQGCFDGVKALEKAVDAMALCKNMP